MLAYARMLPGVQGLNIGPCRGNRPTSNGAAGAPGDARYRLHSEQ